jgi:raffinose/stachyose/melibiose transport system permease protein
MNSVSTLRKTRGSPDSAASVSHAPRKYGRNAGLPWIVPALVVSVGTLYYCIGYTGFISTTQWDGASPDRVEVGAQNYATLFHDPIFWRAIEHTLFLFVVTFTVEVVLAFVLAAILHSSVRLGGVYKALIFMGVIIAPATTAPVFRNIFAPSGQLNTVLHWLGLHSFDYPWLSYGNTAMLVVVVVIIWHTIGIPFILYYAAMTNVDAEMLEAARLDGAGNARVLISMVWPSVRRTTLAIAILMAIGALKTFDVPFLITQGGPLYATEFLGTLIYRVSIPDGEVGYGAAISVVLILIALVMAVTINFGGKQRRTGRA